MQTADFIAKLHELFVARTDVFAEGYAVDGGKYRYSKVLEPLTEDVLLQHVQGKRCVGVYQMADDSTVKWFAVDFDAPKGTTGTDGELYAIAYEDARKQVEKLESSGLDVYFERSRSGKGVHVWGFLEAPMPAVEVRRALRPLLSEGDTFDRLYPVQDGISDSKPYGNLIMLPFYGKAVQAGNAMFLDAEGSAANPRTWLAAVKRNPVPVVQHIAAKAPKAQPVRERAVAGVDASDRPLVTGALKVISEYGCQFMRHCYVERKTLPETKWYPMLQVATHFEHGREFAHLLSQDYPNYDANTVDRKFDQARANQRVGCAWIHENFPKLACTGCPRHNGQLLAPHHLAKRTVGELTRTATGRMTRYGSITNDLKKIRDYDDGAVVHGLKWGIDGLDLHTRLRDKELTVVGAPPSIGKTYMMIDAAYRLAKRGVPVFVFSAETGEESLRQRLIARAAKVDTKALRGERDYERLTSMEWHRLAAAEAEAPNLPLYIDYTATSGDDVLMMVEGAILSERISLSQPIVVFFDYLQYGNRLPGEDSDYDRITRLSGEFKSINKILNRPVVVFSQLTRDAEGEERPMLTWFRGSGQIEIALDVGIIITGERVSGTHAPRSLWIVKQRNAEAGIKIDMILDQSFGEWTYAGAAETVRQPLIQSA